MGYTKADFVQLTSYGPPGTDLNENGETIYNIRPIQNTAYYCQNICNSIPRCIGFSRQKGVDDSAIGDCYFKHSFISISNNDYTWNTYVKADRYTPEKKLLYDFFIYFLYHINFLLYLI